MIFENLYFYVHSKLIFISQKEYKKQANQNKFIQISLLQIQSHFLKMQTRNQQEIKGQNKINYKQKNLEYIEKLKEKNRKQQEQKQIQQKKLQLRRQTLKKKILQEASKNRESKPREGKDFDVINEVQHKSKRQQSSKKKNISPNTYISNSTGCISSPLSELTGNENNHNMDHLPRIQSPKSFTSMHSSSQTASQNNMTSSQRTDQVNEQYSSNFSTHKPQKSTENMTDLYTEPNTNIAQKKHNMKKDKDKTDYQSKYIEFLQNLHQANKKEKEIEEKKKKKKQIKYSKMKQELGFANVESKLNAFIQKKSPTEILRTKSAQKCTTSTEPLLLGPKDSNDQAQMPKTVKNFKQKNQQYLEKIKKKRAVEQQKKQEQALKKEKLKQNLKQFVINTVKKNVLQGVYDDQIVDKNQKKKKPKPKKQIKQGEEDDENQQNQDDSSSSSEQEQGQQVKKKKRKLRSFPHCTDYGEWRKKNRLQENQKVFIVTGGYPDLKRALRERGWVQNTDSSSLFFDLKFTLQGRQIDYANLHDFQLVNHFEKNGVVTTKIGLTKSLRNLMWINDTSEDNFYPKCFDLNDQDDKIGFETHFKLCKALSILKIYADSVANRKSDKNNAGIIQDLKLRTQVALSVCRKNIEDVNDVIDKKKAFKVITEKQWQILAQDELNEESLAKKKHEDWLKSIDCKFNGPTAIKQKKQKEKKPKKKSKKVSNKESSENEKAEQVNNEQSQGEQEDELLSQVKQLLSIYEQKFPQYHLTGHNNIWILKPAGLSRGRGITTYNNLIQIQDHMKTKQSQWIAQKYIQNPLIIERRKFDIRQWVIATNFNPLTIWLYDECYIRFSAADYDAKQINNKFIHLCNNSIGAYSKDFNKSHIKGNMYFMEQCRQYLKALEGYDVFEEKIKPQMRDIVIKSLICAVYGIESRKNSHEMFGYDFMVDTNYKVWLLEINSSPSMDYSTHVTSKLVKEVLDDTVKLIIDYANAPKKEKKKVDTGKFKKIYKGIEISDKPLNTAGLNLTLEGMPIRKTKQNNSVKITTFSLDKK